MCESPFALRTEVKGDALPVVEVGCDGLVAMPFNARASPFSFAPI